MTPSRAAISFCRRPNSYRRFFRCSPRVRGTFWYGRGFAARRVIGTYGKKATHPCRCGWLDDPTQACTRAPRCAADYQARISGPLFDRIDLPVDVPALSAADLSLPPPAEGTAEVAARVAQARETQRARYRELCGGSIRTNAEAEGEILDTVASPEASGRQLLSDAVDRMRLSARGFHRVLRVARTLADLEGGEAVRRRHIAEALSYRRIHPARA